MEIVKQLGMSLQRNLDKRTDTLGKYMSSKLRMVVLNILYVMDL